MAGFDGVSSFVNNEGSQLNFYLGLKLDESLSLGGSSTGAARSASGPMWRGVE
ncbi:hypothetical protein D3C83_214710 [compost metagenome]